MADVNLVIDTNPNIALTVNTTGNSLVISRLGDQGAQGQEVELRANATHIQWRLTGDAWQDLILLTELEGPQGLQGEKGDKGDKGNDGTNGIDGLDGADGKQVELQTSATHIQWRYEGDLTWQNLVLLEDLRGPQGIQGIQGLTGNTGATGPKGDKGDTGDQGPQGPAGDIGPAGANGTDGITIALLNIDGGSASSVGISFEIDGGNA